jgi:hypothetical protein
MKDHTMCEIWSTINAAMMRKLPHRRIVRLKSLIRR